MTHTAHNMPVGSKLLEINAPISNWDEAIPLGNGLMGGLLYGEGSQIKISLDRGDLWDERPHPDLRTKDFTWKNLVALKAAENWDEIADIFDKPAESPTPTKIPGGRLEISLNPDFCAETFYLDVSQGLGGVRLRNRQGQACLALLDCFFSATDGVAMVRIRGAKIQGWRFLAPSALEEKLHYPPPETNEDGEIRWFFQASPAGLAYAAVGGVAVCGEESFIAFTIPATLDGVDDPLEEGKSRVRSALEQGFEKLFDNHKTWWSSFFAVSEVTLPDVRVQSHYDLVRYFLGAASRPGAPAMPLQAVWTADDGLPPWRGDYHHDLNTQMMYVSYPAAGHFAEGGVFFDFMWRLMPVFRRFARDFYGADGAMPPSVMSAAGQPISAWPVFSLMPQGNISWVAWMFYRHWLYTRDEAFLKERAYPFCSEIGVCLEDLLQPDAEGILKMPISSSPEIFSNSPPAYLPPNSNYDHDGLQALFEGLSHMADELGIDADSLRWKKLVSLLGPRWITPQTNELAFANGVPFDRSHRHFSHLMSIHPYGQISIEGGEEERRVISASLAAVKRIGVGEWCGYSYSWAACLFARAGQGDDALQYLSVYLDAFISRNGFHLNCDQKGGPGWGQRWNNPRMFTLEGNFMAMEALHEMLLQSWGGVIRVFPALPSVWQDVAFRDLCAQGGFQVSAAQIGGVVNNLQVGSKFGGGLRIKSPWKSLNANGKSIFLDGAGIAEFPMGAGERVVFTPA
jgi:alpha-L-fucosidase 2